MLKFYVHRHAGGNCEVTIMREKGTEAYHFINLTRGHICPCIFDSVESAIESMKNDPNVIQFTKISD